MARVFRRFTPGTAGVDEYTAIPQASGVALLFIVVGDDDPDLIPGFLHRIGKRLGKITPLQGAIRKGGLGLYWSPTGPMADRSPGEHRVPGGAGAADARNDVTAAWVLSQLAGASTGDEEGTPIEGLLSRGNTLPFAASPDVLPIVFTPDGPAGAVAIHGQEVGPVPYFVHLGTPGPLQLSVRNEAEAIAKAIGKVAGLGEESSEPADLAAPDIWGRSFPNLWWAADSDTSPPPWEPIVETSEPGGFGGLAIGTNRARRPTNSCLMGGGDMSDDRGYCPVCLNYLEMVFDLPDAHLEPQPPLTIDGDIRSATSFSGVELWSSLHADRLSSDSGTTEIVSPSQGSPSAYEPEGVSVDYPDGASIGLTLNSYLTSRGRTEVLQIGLELGFRSPGVAVDGQASPGTDLPPDLTDLTDDELANVVFAQLRIVGGPATDHGVTPWYRSEAAVESWMRDLLVSWRGGLTAPASNLMLLRSHDVWLTTDPLEAPDPPAAQGFCTPAPEGTTQRPWVSAGALTVGGLEAPLEGLWPLRLQGEAAPLLQRSVWFALARVDSAIDPIGALGAIAAAQCTGLPERLRPLDGTKTLFTRPSGALCIQIHAIGLGHARRHLVWHERDLPLHLERLLEIVGDAPRDPGESGAAYHDRVLALVGVDRDVSDTALSMREAVVGLGSLLGGYDLVTGQTSLALLGPLEEAALRGEVDQLLDAYGGDLFFDDLMSAGSFVGRRSFVARVRGLVGSRAPLRFSLGSRATGFSYDTVSMRRTISRFGVDDLAELGTAGDGVDLWNQLTEYTDGWTGSAEQELAEATELARTVMQLATQYGRTENLYDTYFDGAAALWATAIAAADAERSGTSAKLIVKYRMLIETPTELFDGVLAHLDGLGVYVPDSMRSTDPVVQLHAALVHVTSGGDVPASATDDALAILAHAGALVGAREAAVATRLALLNGPETPGGPPAADLQAAHDAAVEARDTAVASLVTPFSATVSSLQFVAGGGRTAAALNADGRQRFAIDPVAHIAHLLVNADSDQRRVEAFSRLDHEQMVAANANLDVASAFASMSQGRQDAVAAMIRLADPASTDEPADLAAVAVHHADYLAEHLVDAILQPYDLDAPLARLIAAVRNVPPAQRSAVRSDAAFTTAIQNLSQSTAGGTIDWGTGSISDLAGSAPLADTVHALAMMPSRQGLPERIRFPLVFAEWVRLHLEAEFPAPLVIDGDEYDGQGAMRAARALEQDPGLFGPGTDQLQHVAVHQSVRTLIADSIAFNNIDAESGASIDDALYGAPPASTLGAQSTSTRRLVELTALEAMVAERRVTRGAAGVVLFDAFSAAGPEVDEAATRFGLALARIRQSAPDGALPTVTSVQYAEALIAGLDVRDRVADYVTSRRETATFAAGIAAAAVGIGLSLAIPVTAPFSVMLMTTAAGAGVAAVGTRYAIEGSAYVSNHEMNADFAAGVAEGVIDAASGAVIGRLFLGAAARGAAEGAEAAAAAAGNAAHLGTGAQRALRPLLQGAAEGAISGALAECGQTALDQATWDRSAVKTFALFLQRAASGAAIGAVMGGAFSTPQAVIDLLGADRARALVSWLTGRGQQEVLVGANDSTIQHLADARDLRDVGDIDGARAALQQIDQPDIDVVQLADDLFDEFEPTVPLRRAFDEIAQRSNTLADSTVDIVAAANAKFVPSDQMSLRSRGAGEVRIVSIDPGDPNAPTIFETRFDAEALVTHGREEILHIAEILHGPPSSRQLAAKLLVSRLDDIWTPRGPDWSPYSNADGLLRQRLESLEAYLDLEGINQQQMLDSYDVDTTLTAGDGFVSSDIDDDLLFTVFAIQDHQISDIHQRRALETALQQLDNAADATNFELDDVLSFQLQLDEPPHLTASPKPRDQAKKLINAMGMGSMNDFNLAYEAATPATIDPAINPTTTPFTEVSVPDGRPFRRRFVGPDGEVVLLTQFGGAKVYRLSEVNPTRLLQEAQAGQIIDRQAHYQDLPDWQAHRDALRQVLIEGFAVSQPHPGLDPIQLAEQMVAFMELEPIGFVYGTAALRQFGYDSAYGREFAGTGLAFPGRLPNGQRHHFLPLFLLSRSHLAATEVAGISVPLAMADLRLDIHRNIHTVLSGMTRSVHNGPTLSMSPASLLKQARLTAPEMNGARPGVALLRGDGRMNYAVIGDGRDGLAPNQLYPLVLQPAANRIIAP